MPAPTKDDLKAMLTIAALNKFKKPMADTDGSVKLDADKNVIYSAELPDSMKDLIEVFADGLSQAWVIWQAKQIIAGVSTAPGSPIVPSVPSLP